MSTTPTQDTSAVVSTRFVGQYQAPVNVSSPQTDEIDAAYRQLTFYEKSRKFNDTNIESIIQKKLRQSIQAGLECSSFVQELVAGHAEEDVWLSRRKEFLQSGAGRMKDTAKNKLKYMQARNPIVTLFENVLWNSSQAFKRLFAA